MNVVVRSAHHGDIGPMHAIRLAVRENPLPPLSGITEDTYRTYIESGSAWVAERSQKIVGFAAVNVSSTRVWALFVAPDAQGMGVGRLLHDHMIAWAVSEAIERLALETAANTTAEVFYRARGWKEVGQDDRGQVCFIYDLIHQGATIAGGAVPASVATMAPASNSRNFRNFRNY